MLAHRWVQIHRGALATYARSGCVSAFKTSALTEGVVFVSRNLASNRNSWSFYSALNPNELTISCEIG